jgi:bifunctional DNase/RNase
MEREVKVRGLILDPTNNSPVVILKDVASEAMLPIWIGVFEANAIAMEIEKAVPQRPMTHDLLKNVIAQLGATVERVIITDLRDSTFYAVIILDVGGEKVIVDSRPSDAIALALRTDSPIFVAEHVMRSSRSVISDEEVESEEWSDDIGGESGDPYRR